MEWINVCDDLACERNTCIETKDFWKEKTYEEEVICCISPYQNCFLNSCVSSSDPVCDTKVYITWVGKDRRGRVMISDNYRLSNFMDYSMNTLLSSAQQIGSSIYNKVNSYLESSNKTL